MVVERDGLKYQMRKKHVQAVGHSRRVFEEPFSFTCILFFGFISVMLSF